LSLESRILELADRCVKCGLCLPQCPTYRYSRNESESPRGRIAILQGLASGQLAPINGAINHLSTCLDCRNCESACPAGVEYETLFDTGQQWIRQHSHQRTIRQRLARFGRGLGLDVLTRPARLQRLHSLLRFYQRSGLQLVLRRSGLLRLVGLARADNLLPPLSASIRFDAPPAVEPVTGHVALFTGCLGSTLEQDTLKSAITLLHRLGYAISLAPAQRCCGALAWHAGELEPAMHLAQSNLAAFDLDAVDAVIYTATGCGAHLLKYPQLAWTDSEKRSRAQRFADKCVEITAFLANSTWPEQINWQQTTQRVAVHEPCSQRNGLRQPDYSAALLKKIPGLDTVALPGNARCCGAGGSTMLSQPTLADALRQDTLRDIALLDPDVVVSTNPGCALFLNAGLGHHTPLRVVHPVVVLAQQLRE
jgi:glycolate oxidase iron-sulfur subunit